MTTLFGSTRSVVTPHYALITPAGFVSAPLPGWSAAESVVVLSPAIGARFAQLLITLGPQGRGQAQADDRERLVFVLDGAIAAAAGGAQAELAAGGYAYLPPGLPFSIGASGPGARLLIFERRYIALTGTEPPAPLFGNEQQIAGAAFMGDEAALLKNLLPDTPAFDMAVNIFTFQPGATLPIVETHVMEHGLLMIQGQGIYRLGSDWHPVQAGDVIWMAPYCPQWFVATGKEAARYIYYKDVNRDALALT
jgi:(S)-ureidoglycine aminohydrolase